MENEKLICFAPGAPDAVPAVADRKVAVTETRSPAEKGRLGEKAVPWPGCVTLLIVKGSPSASVSLARTSTRTGESS